MGAARWDRRFWRHGNQARRGGGGWGDGEVGKGGSREEKGGEAAGPPLSPLYLMRSPIQLLLLLLPAQDGGQAPGAAPPSLCPRRLLHKVPPHPRVVLQPVTYRQGRLGRPGGPARGLRVRAKPSSPLLCQGPRPHNLISQHSHVTKTRRPREGEGLPHSNTGDHWPSHCKKANPTQSTAPAAYPPPRPPPLTLEHHDLHGVTRPSILSLCPLSAPRSPPQIHIWRTQAEL